MKIRRRVQYILGIFLSLVIEGSMGQVDPYDTTPYVKMRDDDCAPELTKNHQRFLFTNYRALYDYRKYHHDYDRLEATEKTKGHMSYQTANKGKDSDRKDRPDRDGSVVFHNWDDNSILAHLSCPCGTRSTKDGAARALEDARMQPLYDEKEKIVWKMYGKGSSKFNDDYGDSYKNPLKFTAPTVRYYFRTFSCELKDTKNRKYHYFNVFSRPTGYTDFPVMVPYPGIGDHTDTGIQCKLRQYYRELDVELEEKDTYYGAPFQYYWKFPDPAKREFETSEEELSFQRPPTGGVYWGKQVMNVKDKPKNNVEESSVYMPYLPEKTTKLKVDFKNELMRPKNRKQITEIYNKKYDKKKKGRKYEYDFYTSSDDCEQDDYICKERLGVAVPTVLRNRMKFHEEISIAEHGDKMRGKYACIVVDVNGLSSAFWWDGDTAPRSNFRAYVTIHVRSNWYAWIALITIPGVALLIFLAIFFIPDNKEDFIDDSGEDLLADDDDKELPPPTGVIPPSETSITTPPQAKSAVALTVEPPIVKQESPPPRSPSIHSATGAEPKEAKQHKKRHHSKDKT